MSPEKILHTSHSIVFLGKFNPTIFTPSWFSLEGLIRRDEGKAELKIAHPEISVFSLDWCTVEVQRDKFKIATTGDHNFPLIRDLAVGTFTLLFHTPISKMGVNFNLHYDFSNKNRLEEYFKRMVNQNALKNINKNALFENLTFSIPSYFTQHGYTRIKIEKSNVASHGVFLDINNHFDLDPNSNDVNNSEAAIATLSKEWKNIFESTETLYSSIIS